MIGQNVLRPDGQAKASGRAAYLADLYTPDMLVAKVLHSSIVNGRVSSMEVGAALALPGVVKIVTCFDVPQRLFSTAGHPLDFDGHGDVADRLLLHSRVRYLGDDIAAVVATDEETAKAALALIKVEYEEYPATYDGTVPNGAPPIHKEAIDNLLARSLFEAGAMPAELPADAVVVEDEFVTQMAQGAPIERAASFCRMEDGRLTVYCATQVPHILKRLIHDATGYPAEQINIVKPYLGGGFGMHQDALYQPLNAYLCLQVGGRGVRLELDRGECLWNTRVRHPMRIKVRSVVKKDGRLLSRQYLMRAGNGAYASQGHAVAENGAEIPRLLYPPQQALRVEDLTYYTNLPAAGAMRGYGALQNIFAVEAHTDNIARRLGLDPLELRQKQLASIICDPKTGLQAKSCELQQCIELAKQAFGWDNIPYRRQSDDEHICGKGMALGVYKSGVYPALPERSAVRLKAYPDGRVEIFSSIIDIGQGADTVLLQMAAETLQLPVDRIVFAPIRSTEDYPYDHGAFASRQSYVCGHAIKQAAEKLKAAIDALQGRPLPPQGLEAAADVEVASNTFSFSACFAQVEVDIKTGAVRLLKLVGAHDCGRVINPLLARGQAEGGMAMGVGFALSEEIKAPGGFHIYLLPTALDLPEQQALFVDGYDPSGPYGNKSLGELPILAPPAAIRNAVTAALDCEINQLPLTPQRLLEAIKNK